MQIITRKHCQSCGREISHEKERKRLYDRFVIDGDYCIYCIGKIDFKAKD